MNRIGCIAILSTAVSQVYLTAAKPVVASNGVVNAASFASSSSNYAIGAGSLVSIFGQNLAPGTAAAGAGLLPTRLLGTSILINGVPAPLYFVAPNQVNFQLPSNAIPPAMLVVNTSDGRSDAVSLANRSVGPGLFTLNGSGCGQGAILNDGSDGTVTVNSSANSVSPGDFITVFGTGFGSVGRSWDGIPIPVGTLLPLAVGDAVRFDGLQSFPEVLASFPLSNRETVSTFAGAAPLTVGVDQINVQVPVNVREGCSVPLQVAAFDLAEQYSQAVTVSIRKGGGQCVDPPDRSYGQITLVKRSVSGSQRDGVFLDFDALFPSSPNQQAPTATVRGGHFGYESAIPPPFCPVPAYRKLNAGTLVLQPSGNSPVRIDPVSDISGVLYHQTVPADPATTGVATATVISAGQVDVGSFQTVISVGHDIVITNPPGAAFDNSEGLMPLSWHGGDPDSFVSVSLISHLGSIDFVNTCGAPASAGQCRLFVDVTRFLGVTTYRAATRPTTNGEMVYTVYPNPSMVQTFSASGLSTDQNIATWRIEHHFALTIP